MSKTRNHHYISQFYLRGFSRNNSKKSQLYVFDLKNKKEFISAPKNVGSKRDFNRITFEANPNYIEDELAKIEGKLSITFKKVIMNKIIQTQEEWQNIFYTMMMFYIRNPKPRAVLDTVFKAVSKKLLYTSVSSEEMVKDKIIDKIEPYQEMKNFISNTSNYNIEINQEIYINSEFKIINDGIKLLLQRTWYFFISENGEFITSDNPTSIIPILGQTIYGLETKDTEIIFPISKDLCIIGDYKDFESKELIGKVLTANKELIQHINGKIILSSTNQIYSSKKEFQYRDVFTNEIKSSSNIFE